jgi:hypothetical protein
MIPLEILKHKLVVGLLVFTAVGLQIECWQKVQKIREQAKFQQQLIGSLDELEKVSDEIYNKNHR